MWSRCSSLVSRSRVGGVSEDCLQRDTPAAFGVCILYYTIDLGNGNRFIGQEAKWAGRTRCS